MSRFSEPGPLTASHALDGFDCGEPSLNDWLCRYALGAFGSGSARTFVIEDTEQRRVVGYHALTVASIKRDEASGRLAKGMPSHPIPVVLLARLAVDRPVQGQGLGAWLLADAMERSAAAAELLGIRALVVHALNDTARAFYVRHGLRPAETDERHLMILIKDIRKALRKAR